MENSVEQAISALQDLEAALHNAADENDWEAFTRIRLIMQRSLGQIEQEMDERYQEELMQRGMRIQALDEPRWL